MVGRRPRVGRPGLSDPLPARVATASGPRADQAGLLLRGFGAYALARQNVGRQHHAVLLASAGDAGQAIAAIDELLDGQFEIAYDRNSRDRPGGLSYIL